MVKFLHNRILANAWMTPNEKTSESVCQGVLLRQNRGVYISQPTFAHHELMAAVSRLNVGVAFTMFTATTDVIFDSLSPSQTEFTLSNGSQYQIIESMSDISKSASTKIKRFQYACLVRKERLVLLWHDEVQKILSHAAIVERNLLASIWGSDLASLDPTLDGFPSGANSPYDFSRPTSPLYSTAKRMTVATTKEFAGDLSDEENQVVEQESLSRPLSLLSSIFVGLAMTLMIFLVVGLQVSKVRFLMSIRYLADLRQQLVPEALQDGQYLRFALVAVTPFVACFGLFFFIVIFSNLFQMFGPVTSIRSNTRFHSAIPPNIAMAERQGLGRPHMTIQVLSTLID